MKLDLSSFNVISSFFVFSFYFLTLALTRSACYIVSSNISYDHFGKISHEVARCNINCLMTYLQLHSQRLFHNVDKKLSSSNHQRQGNNAVHLDMLTVLCQNHRGLTTTEGPSHVYVVALKFWLRRNNHEGKQIFRICLNHLTLCKYFLELKCSNSQL